VFIVEYALAHLWMHWGVAPAAVVGHSLGAFAAACVAGILSFAEAIELVVERGRMLQSLPAGAMLAIPLPDRDVADLLGDDLSVAAINGPAQSVVSGPAASIEALQARLAGRGVDARRLNIATGAHSSLVDPIAGAFRRRVAETALHEPTIAFLSDTTGTWCTPGEVTDPTYWAAHMRKTVRFSDALATLLAEPDRALLEVGPGRTLATLARQHPGLGEGHVVVQTLPHPSDAASELNSLLGAAGHLWLAGIPISWAHLHDGQRRGRVRLPTYPFQRQRYLLEPLPPSVQRAAATPATGEWETIASASSNAATTLDEEDGAENDLQRTLRDIFAHVLGVRRLTVHDSFFDMGGDSLIAAQLVALVREAFPVEISARVVFEAPTVAELATLIEARLGNQQEEVHTVAEHNG
jgi:acyl transferase domain-containing protein